MEDRGEERGFCQFNSTREAGSRPDQNRAGSRRATCSAFQSLGRVLMAAQTLTPARPLLALRSLLALHPLSSPIPSLAHHRHCHSCATLAPIAQSSEEEFVASTYNCVLLPSRFLALLCFFYIEGFIVSYMGMD